MLSKRLLLTVTILALLLVASSASAQTFHNAWSGTGTGTPQTANITVSGFVANDLIVVGIRLNNETATAVITDNGSSPMDGTWACVGPTDHSSAGANIRAYLCYGLATSGNPSTITVTASAGSVGLQAVIGRISGTPTVAPLDASGTGETASATTTHGLTAPITTTQTGDMLIGWIATDTAATFTAGSPPSYQIPLNGFTFAAALQYASAPVATTYDSPFTTAVNEHSIVLLAAFKAAGGGGGGGSTCKGHGMLLGVGGC